jgi:uncharacterized membrane protein YfcA
MESSVEDQFWWFVLAGFCAQMVDGALSMAYGVTASSILAVFGVPPAVTSATVHAAETFTTGFSLLSHRYFGNIDWRLFRRLLVPGVAGAVAGAYVLSSFPGDTLRPFVSGYLLLMGVVIIVKAFRTFPPIAVTRHLTPLGFGGAFVDAVGGGGWGPIVASTLIARGNAARTAVGSVCASEFFVTLAASITFLMTIGLSHWPVIAGLALGGAIAAPFGAWACRHLPARPLMLMAGTAIVALSLNVLLRL